MSDNRFSKKQISQSFKYYFNDIELMRISHNFPRRIISLILQMNVNEITVQNEKVQQQECFEDFNNTFVSF